MEWTWKVPAEEGNLGGMPPDTPRSTLPLRASLFHDTNNFYQLLFDDPPQKFLHRPLNGALKNVSNRAPDLLRPAPPRGAAS